MYKVYLAGPITGLTHADAQEWRGRVSDSLRHLSHGAIVAYSPLRLTDHLRDQGVIDGSYEEGLFTSQRGLFARDRHDVMTADLVLVNLLGATRVSVGTVMEVAWAEARGTPVVLAMEPGNPHEHPMVLEACPFIVPTLHDAVQAVCGILLP